MNQSSERIPCPHCGTSNFKSSIACWQCSKPLHANTSQPPAYNPGPPSEPPPGYYPQPPEPRRPEGNTQIFIILGFIFAVIGVFCCPVIFSSAAIILGVLAHTKGDKLGIFVIVAGVISLIIGVIFGVMASRGFLDMMREVGEF